MTTIYRAHKPLKSLHFVKGGIATKILEETPHLQLTTIKPSPADFYITPTMTKPVDKLPDSKLKAELVLLAQQSPLLKKG